MSLIVLGFGGFCGAKRVTILGLEMAVPILWAPGIFLFFLLENPHAHKIPLFRAGDTGRRVKQVQCGKLAF